MTSRRVGTPRRRGARGAFAAIAFARPGERFRYRTVPKLFMRLFAREFYAMRVAFERWGRPPYPAEITEALSACRSMNPGMLSVEGYLRSEGYDSKVLGG